MTKKAEETQLNRPKSIIKLDIGGGIFHTYYETLFPSRYFRMLLNNMKRVREMRVDNTYIFIDRSKDLFKYVLQFLRLKKLNISSKDQDFLLALDEEATFYQIKELQDLVRSKMDTSNPFISNFLYKNNIHFCATFTNNIIISIFILIIIII